MHGLAWVWMHVGARGWVVLPPAELQRIGLCRWRDEQAGERPLVLTGSDRKGREEFWRGVGNKDV